MTMPWFRSLCASTRRRPAVAVSATAARRRAARRSRPSLEAMESRQLLTTIAFPVTTVGDNGDNASPLAGSLRAAIIRADNVGPGNTAEIDFALPGGGPQTISPVAPLPTITSPTFLNGTSEAGYSGTPLIQIDGSQAGAGAVGLTITSQGNGSQVSGLEVNAFSGGGVLLNGASNVTLDHDWVGVHTLISYGTPR